MANLPKSVGPKARSTSGRAGKRDAILGAARLVFGEQGYSRTSIDAIAARANVSTRTIYNHFDGKDSLFSAVLESSAREVADGFARRLDRADSTDDARETLIVLGRAFASQRADSPEHFAVVAQIRVEETHFPIETIQRWQAAGPERVQAVLAGRLGELAEEGAIESRDLRLAAVHFGALVTADLRPSDLSADGSSRMREVVEKGVDAFLHGYGRKGSIGD
jgi:AcrR family transcriptional regulator